MLILQAEPQLITMVTTMAFPSTIPFTEEEDSAAPSSQIVSFKFHAETRRIVLCTKFGELTTFDVEGEDAMVRILILCGSVVLIDLYLYVLTFLPCSCTYR